MSVASAKKIVNHVLERIIASPLLGRFRTRICHTTYYVIEGKTKEKRHNLRALVFGRSDFLHHLVGLVYSEVHQTTNIGRTTLKNIARISEEVAPDIMFAEFDGVFSDTMSEHFLILPLLSWTLGVAPSMGILTSKMKRLRRRGMRAIQKTDYTYEHTHSSEEFDFFYDRMYLPHISTAHGESLRISSKEQSRRLFQRGGLCLVRSGGECVSGILFTQKNHTVKCELLGMNERADRGIAGQAALYGVINYAKEEGFTEVDYGLSWPFASDGLFGYKRTWGMQVKPFPESVIGLHLYNLSEGVIDFLENNPLIFACVNDLAILAWLNTSDINAETLRSRFHTAGLAQLVVFHPINAKVKGLVELDSSLKQSLTALLPFKQLPKEEYCAHVLEFGHSEAGVHTKEDAHA